MDNLLYISLTNIICLISFAGAIVIIVICALKKTIKPLNIILFLLFLTGMYLYIPMYYTNLGFSYQKPKYLQRAIKLSINPYEKRLCYKYLAEIYADDIFYQGIKDGSKAIEYMERSLKGNYAKYPQEAENLAFWYSIKGDEEKTLKIANELNVSGIFLLNIYIMKDDYKNALSTFPKDNNGIENYLIADLYKKLGNLEAYKKEREKAQKKYDSILNNIKIRARKLEFKETVEKYKSTEEYKKWILAKRKEYGFN